MSVAELKNDLHRMIVETDDPAILEQVVALFSSLKEGTNWWEQLSEAEKLQIEQGAKDIEEGKTTSLELVKEKVQKVLKKN